MPALRPLGFRGYTQVTPRPRVAVLFTGGTISMTVDPDAGGAVPTLAGADLLARIPGLDRIAEIVPIDRGATPASHFSFADVLSIYKTIRSTLKKDPTLVGFVVVQGTDVMEETAFAWDLLHIDPRPVVVTGAMRNASQDGWDGPANFRDAVRVAVAKSSRQQGCVVVLNGRIIPGDDVGKTHSTALDTFKARNGRWIGSVGEWGTRIRDRGDRRVLPLIPKAAVGPVALITAALDTDGFWLDKAVTAGAKGIVVAATGAGNTHPDLLRAATAAMGRGIPVVVASRTGAGPVGPFYAFPGGGATWARAGAIMAGTLSPVQARVALSLALACDLAPEGLRALLGDPAR